jgi:NUMOD4 motif/HNH endonuclease
MTEIEIWKDIAGYEGLYQVSNLGRVKSLARAIRNTFKSTRQLPERILKPATHTRGYLYVNLTTGARNYKHCYVHRLVGIAFIGAPPFPDAEINHKNGIKTDNHIENLEWVTPLQNMTHAWENGLINNRGENQTNHKLTDDIVRQIKALKGQKSTYAIAKQFGTHQSSVHLIHKGKIWAHVK